MKLVDVEPIIEEWKEAGNSKKAKAKSLMNSGIYSECNKGIALDAASDLVLALSEQLENAPSTAWTNVKDKQPEEDGIYLAVYDFLIWKNLIGKRKFVNGEWVGNRNPVKFWMLILKIPGDNA